MVHRQSAGKRDSRTAAIAPSGLRRSPKGTTDSAVFDWPGVPSNITAVCVAALPAYLLNRAWVWGKTSTHSVRGEIVPFWTYSLLGLAFSTILVGFADQIWGTTLSVMAANLVGFGILWVGKFVLLEKVLFGPDVVESPEAV